MRLKTHTIVFHANTHTYKAREEEDEKGKMEPVFPFLMLLSSSEPK
jgi:hypothetical protein